MIRDRINLYKSYSGLNVRCYCCDFFNHVSLKCPAVHVLINPERVLRLHARSSLQKRAAFQRKKNAKANSLRINKQVYDSSLKLTMLISLEYFPRIPSLRPNNRSSQVLFSEKIEMDQDIIYGSAGESWSPSFGERLPTFQDYIESEEVCSIEKEMKESDLSSFKAEGTASGSSYQDKALVSLLRDDFYLAFDKMKNFDIYFPHNNASHIIKKFISEGEIDIMKAIRKKSEKEKQKSSQLLKLPSMFTLDKANLENEQKWRTYEALSPVSPVRLMNKKLRQASNLKIFQLNVNQTEEKIAEKSKKIGKKQRWLCCHCKKLSKNEERQF